MTVMIILFANHIKDLKMNSKVFPFMALTLTPLIVLHVFTIEVNLAEVVKLQMTALFKILTYDFYDIKSHMSGKELNKSSFLLAGYKFLSLSNNMGIVYWVLLISIIFLILKLGLYTFKSKIANLTKNSNLLNYIYLAKRLSESLYNYLVVNQIISMMSLVLYLWYEYYEKSCFELTCFRSEVQISSTKMIKLDVVVAIILIIGMSFHFWRIIYLVTKYKWFDVRSELDQSRVFYVKEHRRLMSSGFGKGHDFEMNFLRLQ